MFNTRKVIQSWYKVFCKVLFNTVAVLIYTPRIYRDINMLSPAHYPYTSMKVSAFSYPTSTSEELYMR